MIYNCFWVFDYDYRSSLGAMASAFHQKQIVGLSLESASQKKKKKNKAAYQSPLPDPEKVRVLCIGYDSFINVS